MDIQEAWNKTLKETEIVRSRVHALMTFKETSVPYILLSESSINLGDTVVRKGEVMVERPAVVLPPNIPQFEGFDWEEKNQFSTDTLINFMFVRGISIPSLRYNHRTDGLQVYEGSLNKAVHHYREELQQSENVDTGLIIGPEDHWQLSLLIYICSQIVRNADTDIRKLLSEWKKRNV